MEEFLTTLGSGGIWLDWVPSFGRFAELPEGSFSVSAIFSGAGAVILGKFTSNLGMLTLPLNYAGLLVGALMANYALAGVKIPVNGDLQTPIMLAMTGMCFAGVAMMALMKRL